MVCSEKFAVGRFQTFKGTEQQPELEVVQEASEGLEDHRRPCERVFRSVSSAVSALIDAYGFELLEYNFELLLMLMKTRGHANLRQQYWQIVG